MSRVISGARHRFGAGLRYGVLGLAAGCAALIVTNDAAVARHRHYAASGRHHHHGGEDYAPPASSILVDGNNGAVLEASNADAPRHPASLTKVMTLYLLFERLEAGKIKLDTQFKVSEHASDQDPTKLNLKPGQTIAVEDAIKGIVTKSANDAAVTVAENLGGDESGFAKMMTQKARALGMAHTTYVNASGLPDDDQITTARDQALLGRAIQDRFPRYYKYFATESFVYHGAAMRNHNHLLGKVDGIDGIKTGFTRASGFNIMISQHRDGRFLVGVVMGGPSAGERDAHMRELLSSHFKEAALRRTAPLIADAAAGREEGAQPYAFGKSPMTTTLTAASPRSEPAATASVTARAPAANEPIRPVAVKTISYRTAPVQSAGLAPMPALVPAQAPQQVAAAQPAAPAPIALPLPPAPPPAAAEKPRALVVAAADPASERAAMVRLPDPAKPEPVKAEPARSEPALTMPSMHQAAAAEPPVSIQATGKGEAEPNVPATRIHAHGGWIIQIGAFEDEGDAKQHLSAAQTKVHAALSAKDPFTERILKGDKAYYRARFAGFDRATAEAACKQLKRSDFECMALKD
jgi:D-alanyl-D-alanine carboxypeptidase